MKKSLDCSSVVAAEPRGVITYLVRWTVI